MKLRESMRLMWVYIFVYLRGRGWSMGLEVYVGFNFFVFLVEFIRGSVISSDLRSRVN